MDYKIKRARRTDMDIIIDWAAKEGWNPGIHDAESFYSADPDGFFLGFFDNKPVSSISAVRYGRKFGFLGLYIVKKKHRGKGYGIKIWNHALDYLSGRNIGLDGVLAQQKNYKKSGFKLAYRNIRYQRKSIKNSQINSKIIKIEKISLKKLMEYDGNIFSETRTDFVRHFITQPDSYGFAFEENNTVKGYGLIRKCRQGFKIGPLFADSEVIAQNIYISLQNQIPAGTQFFFDVPEINKVAVKMAEKVGMKPMFETARMYNKFFPEIPLNKIFGVTTFELG